MTNKKLLIIDVEIQRCDEYVKFDVYINDQDEIPSKENQVKTEYEGPYEYPDEIHTSSSTNQGLVITLCTNNVSQNKIVHKY